MRDPEDKSYRERWERHGVGQRETLGERNKENEKDERGETVRTSKEPTGAERQRQRTRETETTQGNGERQRDR